VKNKTLQTCALIAALYGATAQAQSCSLEPGTIGLGNYCQSRTHVDHTAAAPTSEATGDESSRCLPVPPGALSVGRACKATTPTPAPAAAAPQITKASEQPQPQPQPAQVAVTSTVPAKPAAAAKTPFFIDKGQRISTALDAWLAAQGVTLIWDISAGSERIRDIEMIAPWQSTTADIEQTLSQLLPDFGLRAIVQDSPRTVIVRAASGTTSKPNGAAK
jgi:hypothetical protein